MSRPKTFKDYTGNEPAKKILQEAITACKIQGTVLPHILLYGPAGSGKTTLAQIIAAEAGYGLITTIGSVLKNQTDLIRLAIQIDDEGGEGNPSALFIDEIHNIDKPSLQETVWYPILEDFIFYTNLKGKIVEYGGMKYKVKSNEQLFPYFCCIGATTDPGMLTAALRRRFKIQVFIDDYSIKDIQEIIRHVSDKMEYIITTVSVRYLAERSRDNPATAIAYLEAIVRKHVAQNKSKNRLVLSTIRETLNDMGVADMGLKPEDLRVLKMLSKTPKGMGKSNIAQACGLSQTHYTEMVEPFLKKRGWIITSHKTFITPEGSGLL